MNPLDDNHNTSAGENDIPEADESGYEYGAPGRLIDDLVAYLRNRRAAATKPPRRVVDNERLLRSVLRHLRRNPLPTALLGFSISWLLLVDEGEEEQKPVDQEEPDAAQRIEEEILNQMKGGFAYTNVRLRELVDRYPWGAAAAMIGGGLLAALLLPERHREEDPGAQEDSDVEPEVEDEFDLEEPGEGGEDYR